MIQFRMRRLAVRWLGVALGCWLVGGSPVAAEAPPQSEVDALRALYEAAGGSDWKWTGVAWDFTQPSPDPCEEAWQGISCQSTCDAGACQDHVVGLELDDVNMDGTIPEQIAQLSLLTNLTLRANYGLTGSIPMSICDMRALEILKMDSNHLLGSLPRSIGNLSALRELILSNNVLVGSLPPSIGKLSNLVELNLYNNELTGNLPPEVGGLQRLKALALHVNLFNGSLPAEIGNMVDIVVFVISNNRFSGELPKELRNLKALRSFKASYNGLLTGPLDALLGATGLFDIDLTENRFNGQIPSGISELTALRSLHLGNNGLEGTLPMELGLLSDLLTLVLSGNRIGGTLPKELSQLTKLVTLDCSMNLLHGPLPASYSEMIFLQHLVLHQNILEGSIPDVWCGNMPRLWVLDLSSNWLTGTLSAHWGRSNALQRLVLYDNYLGGTLPAVWETLTSLTDLLMGMNSLHGSLPDWVAMLPKLQGLDFSVNQLTGTVPTSLAISSTIIVLELNHNILTGNANFLPVSVQFLNLSLNAFTGTMSSLSANPDLVAADVSQNALSGSVPLLASHNSIQILFLGSNMFRGSIDSLLSSGNASGMVYLDVSSNRLTGSIPDRMVNLNRLMTFVAMENCFEGTLPASLCKLESAVSLVLDGLSSAAHCRTEIAPGVLPSYYLPATAVHGSIPPCLFAMKRLQVLHLSGNALTGSVALNGTLGLRLKDISLSHNQLTGSIPSALQGGQRWISLDLSFNKLYGHLSNTAGAFAPSASVTVEENRLSGDIPESYFSVTSVNILRGNMFRCQGNGAPRHLPEGDPYRRQYGCGSDSLNIAFSVWCVLAALVVLAAGWVAVGSCRVKQQRGLRRRQSRASTVTYGLLPEGSDTSWGDSDDQRQELFLDAAVGWIWSFRDVHAFSLHAQGDSRAFVTDGAGTTEGGVAVPADWLVSVFDAGIALQNLRSFACVVAMILVVVVSPVYIGLSIAYGSYEEEFAWTNSAAFLSGTPSAVVLVVLFVSLAILLPVLRRAKEQSSVVRDAIFTAHADSDGAPALAAAERDSGLAISMHSADSTASPAMSSLGSVLCAKRWPRTLAVACINVTVVLSVNAAFVVTFSSLNPAQAVVVALALSLFKIAWGVALRQGVVRRLQPPQATGALRMSNVGFVSAMMLFNNIVAPCLATLLVNPSCFSYVFARPPSVSTTYAVFTCLQFENGICAESEQIPKVATFQPPFTYEFQCSSALLVDYAYVFAYKYALLGLAYPALVLLVVLRLRGRAPAHLGRWDHVLMLALPPLWKADLLRDLHAQPATETSSSSRLTGGCAWVKAMERDSLRLAAFSSGDYAVRMATMFGALLTFGAVLPGLGMVVVFAIVSNTALTQMGLARLARQAASGGASVVEAAAWRAPLKELNRQCSQLMTAVRVACRPLATLVLMFYAAFVFDTEGGVAGAARGALLALPVVAVPVAVGWGRRMWWRKGSASSEEH